MEGLSRTLDLARARFEMGMWGPGPISARVALIAARSGGGTAYLGIDGEAIVPKIQIAEARIDVPRFGLSLAAGMVDHPWLMHRQATWGYRIFSAPPVGSADLAPRSDLGGWVSWTAPKDIATVTASLTTGEGADRRERNNGMDVTVVASVRPLAAIGLGNALELSVGGTEGSRGIERARNHRLGGAVTARQPWVVGAIEGHVGWGDDGDPDLLPAVVSGWARTGPELPMLGWLRLDAYWADRRDADSRTLFWTAGTGPWLPWSRKAPVRPIYVAVGYEGRQFRPEAQSLAGAEASAVGHTLFAQVGVLLAGGVPVSFGPAGDDR
jgi:hypothetical protein